MPTHSAPRHSDVYAASRRRHSTIALLAAGAVLAACGTYEPPKPGVHKFLSRAEADAEQTCGYETPMGSKFMVYRCRGTSDIQAGSDVAKETADTIKTEVPRP